MLACLVLSADYVNLFLDKSFKDQKKISWKIDFVIEHLLWETKDVLSLIVHSISTLDIKSMNTLKLQGWQIKVKIGYI